MKLFFLLFALIALSACRKAEELVFLDTDDVSAVRCGYENFQTLLLGSPAKPYSGSPILYFKLADGSEFNVGSKLEGELSRLCNKGKRIDASNKVGIGMYPGRHPRSDKATWGEGAEWIQLLSNYETNQHIDIVVRGEKILGVSIYCDESNLEKPIEVKVEDSTWHTFPLEESSLKDLFGDSNASYQWRIQ